MTSMVAKAATGGALALIGLIALKFIVGMVGMAVGLMFFLLFKVLPIVLVAALAIWLVRKITRPSSSPA